MNDLPNMTQADNTNEARPGAGRLISRSTGGEILSPAQLEARAIIHRQGGQPRAEVDAFRELRTRLLATMDGNFVTLVAPVSAGSGGSFVARNLAVALAFDESKNALLLDCDIRNPSQDRVIGVDPLRGGLINYFENPDTDISGLLYETGVPRLSLIPVGAAREASAEYFSSARMRLLIDSLRSSDAQRYIYLDSPPVRGAPDARILSDLADVVVLVAGYGRDTPNAISQAAANFDPAKFAGVVFNEGV